MNCAPASFLTAGTYGATFWYARGTTAAPTNAAQKHESAEKFGDA